jgi:hypothetical protein
MGTKSPKNTARMLALFERGLARKMPLLGLAGLLEYLARRAESHPTDQWQTPLSQSPSTAP